MPSSQPLVAIIDWKTSPLGDPDSCVEKSVIGSHAEVRRYLCESDADFTEEICEAAALIVWHNAPMRAPGLSRLKHCRALIRNGVGFDSVDITAARQLGITVCG